ncbi:MAG: hypothetical protein ACRCVT_12545 [Leadbetterella sp.]
MKILTYSSLLLTILLLITSLQAHSQNTDNFKYPPSEAFTIHSQILQEDRKVNVSVPKFDSAEADIKLQNK